MNIICKNITFSYQEEPALKDINLSIASGELIALLGPSGCGKTTLLRLLSGLLPMQNGGIWYDEKEITHDTPQQRNTVMVFQSYALFPHMSVFDNIAYGLKARGLKKIEIQNRTLEYIKKVHLNGLENRMIQELSGGQQQRVALARALVLKPDVLLFDEPLSNLDEKLRVKMRRNIKALQKESGITTVYVTHDQKEAMAIADRIVVMDNGCIQQIGSPQEVYHNPQNEFVSDFMGVSNHIHYKG
ncbi:MAG: ABC transporter ATP-binding protein, partial [Clostridia bacterium]|nr:ABC transporter ATP-binding protein [Clostridia bacterium]